MNMAIVMIQTIWQSLPMGMIWQLVTISSPMNYHGGILRLNGPSWMRWDPICVPIYKLLADDVNGHIQTRYTVIYCKNSKTSLAVYHNIISPPLIFLFLIQYTTRLAVHRSILVWTTTKHSNVSLRQIQMRIINFLIRKHMYVTLCLNISLYMIWADLLQYSCIMCPILFWSISCVCIGLHPKSWCLMATKRASNYWWLLCLRRYVII